MGDDVSAEIRSARQKSRGKVIKDPEDQAAEDVAEEEMNILEQPAPTTPREAPTSSQGDKLNKQDATVNLMT